MKNLLETGTRAEIRGRIASLTAADTRRWGTLTVEEMMAHVRQAYVAMSAGRDIVMEPVPMPRWMLKFFALSLPMEWPKTIQTATALQRRNMPPVEGFADESTRLLTAFDHFVSCDRNTTRHPMFGAMRPADWMRWGYLHADHHLRQFGR